MDDSGHRQDSGLVAGKGAPYGWRNGKYKHGMKGSPEWKAWVNARRRCTDPNHPDWDNYGGRGIRMCSAWQGSFSAFIKHIGPRPDGHMLDRINNNAGYYPGNVRWATRGESNRNKRRRKT